MTTDLFLKDPAADAQAAARLIDELMWAPGGPTESDDALIARVEAAADDPTDDVGAYITALNRAISRHAPDGYVWAHGRWYPKRPEPALPRWCGRLAG
jgi:hypothetical protein